jgi:molecular chaperone Hsp33
MHNDSLSRILCETLSLKAYTLTSIGVAKKISELHATTPNATVALCRTINAAALLSATLKPGSDQSLMVKIEGTGPIKEIHVQADARGNIRGYIANPLVDLTGEIGEISFSKTVGAGFLTVKRDIGLKEPYTSVLPLVKEEIASNIAYYLTVSEQIPSALIIALNLEKNGSIASSGGILIQTFPDTPKNAIAAVEKNISNMKKSLGDRLKSGENIHAVLEELLDNEPIQVLSTYPVRESCRCGKEILAGILENISLGELQDMRDRDKGAEVICTFCTKRYHFDETELMGIIQKKDNSMHPGNSALTGDPVLSKDELH